ncbi:winged helix-turn-helix domain-containing protein [Enterococcus termitis]
MYKLGIVSQENYSEEILSEFEKRGFSLTQLDKAEICTEGLDGIFIEENHEHSISCICELVLSVRRESDVFIWILSKKSTTVDRQVYLQLGVDNVFNRKYFPTEPLLIIRNTFTRQDRLTPAESEETVTRTRKEMMQLNPRNLSIYIPTEDNKMKEISLTKLEYRIIELLHSSPGKTFSYKEIYENLWDEPYNDQHYRVLMLYFT